MSDENEKQKQEDIKIADLGGGDVAAAALANTKAFTVTWTNRETGQVKTGTFTATRPTLGQIGKIAVIKARLNGGERVDPDTDFMHEMLAALQLILTDVPEWWTPTEFFDPSPLREVWDHVRSWLDTFRSRRMG